MYAPFHVLLKSACKHFVEDPYYYNYQGHYPEVFFSWDIFFWTDFKMVTFPFITRIWWGSRIKTHGRVATSL